MTNRTFTILLVDDRPENLIALEHSLEKEGRHFLKAHSGNDALKIILKNPQIGLIMLDVQMPDMDGFEVARLLKSNPKTRDISIIFVTAISKEEQYVLKGFEEGAVDYLQKPLDIDVTRAKVNVFEQLYFYQMQLKQTISEKETINKQLERFVYTVSHDLKSPLSGIITTLSFLTFRMEMLSKEDLRKYMDLLEKASLHLNAMVESILDYSRKSYAEQTQEEVDVSVLVRDIAQLLFPPDHIRIELKDPFPVLYTRKLKLQQVFQNLISNAIKYNDKPEGIIEIGCKKEETKYCFYVRDNGPGIAENDQDTLFGLFKTGEKAATRESSTGVGLNLLKVLVEEQGGSISVESTREKEAPFTLSG